VSELVVVWSGALHRQGAPGLSTYRGHSQLYRPRQRAARVVEPLMVGNTEREERWKNEARRKRRARQRARRQIEGL